MRNQLYWSLKKITLVAATILGLFTHNVQGIKIEQRISYPLNSLDLIVEKQRMDSLLDYDNDVEFHLRFWDYHVIFNTEQTSISIKQQERP
ncbi:hypothetical protein ERUR111494_04440 [Erysipelothrix urinaevulpis]|uniref:hypothetical protein n=1 Tax=Erysipelothrix urinaevulpis TaxID=2683717 RepID=UPI00135686DF|nr:hypothetical protein [Erysipelothrix urinaevulpis]